MLRLVGAVLVSLALAGGAPARADTDAVTAALDAAITDDHVPGVIAVLRNGADVTQYSAGLANVAERRPFVPRMHVRAASITKTFVATVVMQLVASDDMSLESPVAQYLPGRIPDGITVRQLLRHQSGLPEYFSPAEDPDNHLGTVDPSGLLDSALSKPASFAPGADMAYTNTNYLVAGLLIEAVTGRPAVDEIGSRIISRLGLVDTYFPAPGDTGLLAPFVSGYERVDGQSVDETAFPAALAATAGGLVSTGEDITAFVTALLSGELLPAAQLGEMMQTVPQPGTEIGYGLGLASFALSCGVTLWGHGGDVEGYHSLMVKPAEPVDAPALSVTLTQSPDADGLAQDPRNRVAEALYC
ncbi:MAG: serine hydrolase domain-containing protein [Mycobacterium sp.]